jgi:hypothetical protein
MCDHFERLWDRALRLAQPKPFNVTQTQQVDFPRWDYFHRMQPPMYARKPCPCGSPSAWECWHKVKMSELLGEGRR